MATAIPKNERQWLAYYDKCGVKRFVMTSSAMRDYYYLYEVSNGSFVKLGKDRSPKKLEEKFCVDEKLRSKHE